MTLSAILWDMDGTLIDSEPAHGKAFDSAVAELGFELPPGTHDTLLGSSSIEVHQKLVELTGSAITLEEWQALKSAHYQNHSSIIKAMPYSQTILDTYTAQGVPMALVSNSMRSEVELNLSVTGLADYFQTTISRNDVSRGKPEPDCYLLAAEALAVAPESCLVIEDSVTGAKAGLAAGMTTLFHPETPDLVGHCPAGAILLAPQADLAQWLAGHIRPASYDNS